MSSWPGQARPSTAISAVDSRLAIASGHETVGWGSALVGAARRSSTGGSVTIAAGVVAKLDQRLPYLISNRK